MQVETVKKHLETVNKTLSSLRAKVNLIEDIGWTRETEERFFSANAEHLPEPPPVRVDRDALEGEIKEMQRVIASIKGAEPIPVWLRSVLQGALDRNRLLLAAGTPAFGDISKEVYGSASSTFFGLSVRNCDLADHVLERLKIHGWDAAKDKEEETLSAEAFAEELRRRIAKHRPAISVDVVLDPQTAAKAIAGMSRLRIRSDATFLPWEADGLFCHEIETHVFTAQNGAAQPLAPFLKAGGPRTTPTQEGLAVFAELYNHALAIPRLERLAIRVKLVHMAEEGASFLDLYRFLLDRGQAPRDAYLDAARVCRGGIVTGGVPFTKDSSYLAGLVHIYAFLSVFVRGGFRDEVELLVAGRIALDDILALVHLQAMGLLERPRHRPRWLRRWNTLLPFFTFSSFIDEIQMRKVAEHYEEVIKLADSIEGPRRLSARRGARENRLPPLVMTRAKRGSFPRTFEVACAAEGRIVFASVVPTRQVFDAQMFEGSGHENRQKFPDDAPFFGALAERLLQDVPECAPERQLDRLEYGRSLEKIWS